MLNLRSQSGFTLKYAQIVVFFPRFLSAISAAFIAISPIKRI